MSTRHSFLSTSGLIRPPSPTPSIAPSILTPPGSTKPRHNPNQDKPPKKTTRLGNRGVIPLGPTVIVGMAVAISLLFILSISFAFIAEEDHPIFRDLLDDIAAHSPGIVLIGDNVDVDIDEPAVTIRWSIVGCGANYTLPGSEGSHGSSSCGIPSIPLDIYVDNDSEGPTATYDPAQQPFVSDTGRRQSIQNLYQFDSDHVLDVHEARLYPFDTYQLTSTIRAVISNTSQVVQVIRLPTLVDTSSFVISSTDVATYTKLPSSNNVQEPSRDLNMTIRRPGEARFFALLLFAISWMLAHATIGYIMLAWKANGTDQVLKYLAFCIITMLIIPQLRNAMPDAPGYDGVLIDQIGFFGQMLMCGVSVITLVATIAKRELAYFDSQEPESEFIKERPAPISQGLHKLRGSSSSVDFRHMRAFSRNFMRSDAPSPLAEGTSNPPATPQPSKGTFAARFGRKHNNGKSLANNVVYSDWNV